MYPLAIARWVAGLLIRRPLVWLWAALMAAIWPAVVRFSPLGVTTSADGAAPVVYEVAFMACLAGVLLGMAVLQRGAWFLELVEPVRRMTAELSALAAATSVLLVAGLLPVVLLGGAGESLSGSEVPLRALVCWLHLSAVALVLLRLPLPGHARLVILPLATWVVPALLSLTGTGGELASHAFDAARALRLREESVLGGWKASAFPIIGMLWAARLLARPPQPVHEIRNPG